MGERQTDKNKLIGNNWEPEHPPQTENPLLAFFECTVNEVVKMLVKAMMIMSSI